MLDGDESESRTTVTIAIDSLDWGTEEGVFSTSIQQSILDDLEVESVTVRPNSS